MWFKEAMAQTMRDGKTARRMRIWSRIKRKRSRSPKFGMKNRTLLKKTKN